MTDICQELTLGASGPLRTISCDLQIINVHPPSILRGFSFDQLPHLDSTRAHHSEQSSVRLLNFMAKEFKNAKDCGPEENGETNRRMKPFSRGDGRTRKICVLRYVLYPNRPRVGPDPAGQAY